MIYPFHSELVAVLIALALIPTCAFAWASRRAREDRLSGFVQRFRSDVAVSSVGGPRLSMRRRQGSPTAILMTELVRVAPALCRSPVVLVRQARWSAQAAIVAAALLVCLEAVLVWGMLQLQISPLLVPLVALASLAGGFFYLSARRARALERRIKDGLPEAIDLMTRAIRSGIPVAESITVISRDTKGDIQQVFASIAAKTAIGQSVTEAIRSTASDLAILEMKFLSLAISLQQETGGNLGEILANLSNALRRRRQFLLKLKAMTSEARASALIVGSLPFIAALAIYIVNPDYIMKFFIDDRGRMLLAAGAGSIGTAFVVMRRMCNLDV